MFTITVPKTRKENKPSKTSIYESIEFQTTVLCAMQGDKKALNDLCELISSKVIALATYLLGYSEGAEDIAQESLISVCRHIHTLKEPKAFPKWLHTIVVNRKNKYLAESGKRGLMVDINDYMDDLVEDNAELLPDSSYENAELRIAMREIINKLPERQREAILLKYYQGYSQREVAEMMGVNSPCVSNYLKLARDRIKAGIDEYWETSGTKLYSAVPITALIASTISYDFEMGEFASRGTIESILTACSEYIQSGGATVLAEAAAHTDEIITIGGTTVAAGGTAIAASGATAAGGVAGRNATRKIAMTACVLLILGAIGAGVYFLVTGSLEAHPITTPTAPIILTGGESAGEGYITVNPQNAFVNSNEVEVLYWWITYEDTGERVFEGERLTVGEGFTAMTEAGSAGIHRLYVRSISEVGSTHTSYITFAVFP